MFPDVNQSLAGALPTRSLAVVYRPIGDLRPDPRNARTHPKRQIEQLCASLRQFGFTNPVLVDEEAFLIAGHGRLRAAKELGLPEVPCITIAGLSEAEKKAGLQQPLTSFRQVLTSPKTELKLHPGEDIKIPVHIQNPGTETWVSAGQFPVAVSYKWFRDGQMLVIEGERTALPSAIGPNQAADVDVRVIAPPDPGKYGLRLTLVQEAVAWFMLKSNTFLELPVTVQ